MDGGAMWGLLKRKRINVAGLTMALDLPFTLLAASKFASAKQHGPNYWVVLLLGSVVIIFMWGFSIAILRSELCKEDEKAREYFGVWRWIALTILLGVIASAVAS